MDAPKGYFDEGMTSVSLIKDLAGTVKRVRANEDFDDQGIRTIWHRGQRQTELLSWENQAGDVVKQELTFVGFVVELRNGRLRTGKLVQDGTTAGAMGSHAMQLDRVPDHVTLSYASLLLKQIPDRDFYEQHLLKHVNDGLAELGESRVTGVIDIESYQRHGAWMKEEAKRRRIPKQVAIIAGSVATAIVLLVLLIGSC
jgi:hypothetical protein